MGKGAAVYAEPASGGGSVAVSLEVRAQCLAQRCAAILLILEWRKVELNKGLPAVGIF
jgi:hypothetical protein